MEAHTVFISYSTIDRQFALAVCSWLEKNSIRAWMAPRDITPGSHYGEAIIGAIKNAKVMVVVFTKNADASKFVKLEVERAISNGCIIIPARFQDVLPTKDMEFFLSSMHWLDVLTTPIEAHLDKLVMSVKKLLSSDDIAIRATATPTPEKDSAAAKVFNESAPDDWYRKPGKQRWSWISNLFEDKSN